jgi:hypothetical protein
VATEEVARLGATVADRETVLAHTEAALRAARASIAELETTLLAATHIAETRHAQFVQLTHTLAH